MTDLWRDLEYGFRMLIKNRTATVVALLALALGIGVNVACFISVNALVLYPLPFPKLDRVMTLWETVPKLNTEREPVAPADLRDFEEHNRSFATLGAYQEWGANLTSLGEPESVYAARVTPNFFTTLGVQALSGRTFSGMETGPAQARTAVISEGFWRRKFAGSSRAIGATISLNQQRYTVVGIMPAEFDFPLSTEVWVPLTLGVKEQNERSAHSLLVIGRLKPDVTAKNVQEDARSFSEQLSERYPDSDGGRRLVVIPIRQLTNGVTDRFATMLLVTASFVLLLACANVGNLRLAQANVRQREIAIRAALGGSNARIARQLIFENVLLSAVGGILGLELASWNLDLTRQTIPSAVFRYVAGLRDMRIDGTVVAFTAVTSVLVGLLCGLPAIAHLLRRKHRAGLNDALKDGGRSATTGVSRSRMRRLLILSEIALALILLVGTGLMMKAFGRMLDRNLGYDPNNVLRVHVSPPENRYSDQANLRLFYERLLRGLSTIPGVEAAGIAGWISAPNRFLVEGRPQPTSAEPRPEILAASDGLLQALRIPMLKGRAISSSDQAGSAPVAVISESVARQYWPKADAFGRRIKVGNAQSRWLKVVGVCGDTRDWFHGDAIPTLYVPYTQAPPASVIVSIRTDVDPLQLASLVRAKFASIDPELPIYELETLRQMLFEETSGVRVAVTMMSVYAVIALLLAATGIYAVISYSVAQQAHDIGVRMALGADRADVLKLTLGETGRLIAAGLLIGIPAAFALGKVLSAALFDFVALDAVTFLSFTAMLAAVAVAAGYFPAWRATRIDPLTTLREE